MKNDVLTLVRDAGRLCLYCIKRTGLMNVMLLAGLIFWGTMSLVLSELMTVSVTMTQTGLVWLSYGLWAIAGALVVHAVIRVLRERRTKHNEGGRHEV